MAKPQKTGRRGRAAEARQLARASQLMEDGAYVAADALYRQVLDRNPTQNEALSGRASTLVAFCKDPEDLCNHGYECSLEGLYDDAVRCYARARELDPDSRDAVWGVADCSISLDDTETAIEAYRRYLELDPGEPEAMHMLAALGEGAPPPRAADRYVAEYFDRFAPDFDSKLVDELSYRVPGLMQETLLPLLGEPQAQLAVLDLGCGTGLTGMAFRDHAVRLDGIDLSPAMLDRARDRNVYDTLEVAEVGKYLSETADRYDLVIAGDVLAYFGPLAEVFAGTVRVLQPAGMFAFSVEASEVADYRLTPSGRYSHGRDYIRRAAEVAGLREVKVERAQLRTEYAQPVEGDIWVFEKAVL